MPRSRFSAEYECEFGDAVNSVFSLDEILRAFTDDFQPKYSEFALAA